LSAGRPRFGVRHDINGVATSKGDRWCARVKVLGRLAAAMRIGASSRCWAARAAEAALMSEMVSGKLFLLAPVEEKLHFGVSNIPTCFLGTVTEPPG